MRPRKPMPIASSRPDKALGNTEFKSVKDAIKDVPEPEVWAHYTFDKGQLEHVGFDVYDIYKKCGNHTYQFGNIYVAVI